MNGFVNLCSVLIIVAAVIMISAVSSILYIATDIKVEQVEHTR